MARDGANWRSRNVRVFTVNNESRYVLVRNIPALGVIDDLLTRFSLYGKICEYRILDHQDDRRLDGGDDDAEEEEDDRFTDVVWIQYETVNNARHAKVRGVQKPFFGSILHVSYAPHFETKEDTMLKLRQRRELLQRRARFPNSHHHSQEQQSQYNLHTGNNDKGPQKQRDASRSSAEFIGPQLPPMGQRGVKSKAQPPAAATDHHQAPEARPKPKRRRI
ncbi:hypothetical protein FI667_g10571, partial [Globisporangium splendens]